MIRDRIVVGIVDSSLSLKLQLHCTVDSKLTLKKAIDAARQSEAAKREQAQMRNFLPKATNVDFVEAKRQPKSHTTKPKMAGKTSIDQPQLQLLLKVTGTSKMCPAREATCFNCRKVGRFGVVCRSTKSVDAISKDPDPEEAFLGEVTKNDDPWTSTVAMEAMGTLCRAEVCFKLDTGADVTVISQSYYRRAGSPSLDASTKRLVGANDNVLQALDKFNRRVERSSMKTSRSSVASEGHF